jgi:SET domain-containing protein
MNKDVIVEESTLNKKGVFANRAFVKGEVVLKWNPKLISESELEKMSLEEKSYSRPEDGKIYLMQKPERYMNHSCDPNTETSNWSDIAIRDIKKGDEVTSDYGENPIRASFKCKCESKNCRGII